MVVIIIRWSCRIYNYV